MTERSNKGWKWCLLFLLVYTLGLYFYSSYKISKIEPIEIEKIDTITVCDTAYISTRDTFYLTKPIPELIEVVRIDTVKENTPLIVENKTYKDTICNEKDSIILQSTIQGVNAMLLSTEVDWRKHTEVITNTITIEKYIKPKKIRITPQLGVGYGLLNKQTDIYLGIGLSYNF